VHRLLKVHTCPNQGAHGTVFREKFIGDNFLFFSFIGIFFRRATNLGIFLRCSIKTNQFVCFSSWLCRKSLYFKGFYLYFVRPITIIAPLFLRSAGNFCRPCLFSMIFIIVQNTQVALLLASYFVSRVIAVYCVQYIQ